MPALAGETPKRGGTLNYVIPADAPPSFDAHRETTYATIHSAAPFYSLLIRVNPQNPGSTTDFVCDLCTEMPKPTDDGKTYTFKIRPGRQVSRWLGIDRGGRCGELAAHHLSAGRRVEPAREPIHDGR
jgi:ABC-type transport system substrate-binding protein